MTVHVIPVPNHMTVEEAWEGIRLLLGRLLTVNQPETDEDCDWGVVVADD